MAVSGRAHILHFSLPTMAFDLIIHITLGSELTFVATETLNQRYSEVAYVSGHDSWYLSLPTEGKTVSLGGKRKFALCGYKWQVST